MFKVTYIYQNYSKEDIINRYLRLNKTGDGSESYQFCEVGRRRYDIRQGVIGGELVALIPSKIREKCWAYKGDFYAVELSNKVFEAIEEKAKTLPPPLPPEKKINNRLTVIGDLLN